METLINDLIGKLTEQNDRLVFIAEAKAARAAVEAELAGTMAALADAKEELAAAKQGLTNAQYKSIKDVEVAVYAKTNELAYLVPRIEKAETGLAVMTARTDALLQKHDAMLADIEGLRKRLQEA
jgi:hypothetical protein